MNKIKCAPCAMTEKRAFTFIELMLVIVLVSFIAVLSVPRMRSAFNNLEVYNFTNKVASLMRYAQSKAIAELKRVYLIYEPPLEKERGRFRLAGDDEDTFAEKGERIIFEERYSLSVPVTININFKPSKSYNAIKPLESDNAIVFNTDGSINGPQVIVYNDKRKFQLTAGGGIGHVEVTEPPN
jgi:prepilin-type N-terminal cleavage/methylation domain-containing protein